MAVPKRKTSKSRSAMRRSHRGLPVPSLAVCRQCHTPKPPHLVCPVCGNYRGREVYQPKKSRRR